MMLDWSLPLAIATGSLAAAAFWAIWQNYRFRRQERKERLLNEIIEWAADVTKGELLVEFADVADIKDIRRARLYLYTTVDKLHFSFRQARTRGLYISGIVSILGAGLQQAVGELIRNLEVHIQALKECMDATDSPACETTLNGAISAARKTTDSKKLLDESATRVIKEAARIKTKDIGKKEENMSKEGEATGSDEPTMKDIENHLCQQDEKLEKGTYFSGYLFGATLIFIAFGLLAGEYILTTKLWFVTYCIVILIGGIGLIGFAWYRKRKLSK